MKTAALQSGFAALNLDPVYIVIGIEKVEAIGEAVRKRPSRIGFATIKSEAVEPLFDAQIDDQFNRFCGILQVIGFGAFKG